MCQIARKQAECYAKGQSILAAIRAGRDFQISEEAIFQNIMMRYKLTENEARMYLKIPSDAE